MGTVTVLPSSQGEIALPRYDEMCKAIEACYKFDEAKGFRDKAEALRAYSKQANNREAEVQFSNIKHRAERKCGELLIDMTERGERAKPGDVRPGVDSSKQRLSDLGLDKHEASRFKRIAAVPKDQFETALRDAVITQKPVTSSSIRALTRSPKATPHQKQTHERLWRVLRALEQIAEQDITPKQWLADLPDYMLDQVRDQLPSARRWLEKFFAEWDKQHGQ